MKKKVLSSILILLLISIMFIFTGCANNSTNENNDVNSEEGNYEIEENIASEKVELNPELEGTYELAIQDSKIIAVKEDGTIVTILDEPDSNGNCYFSNIEYCAGNLYFSKAYYVETGSSSTNLGSDMKIINKTFDATNHTFYKVDLTKGDGNYEIELLYDYETSRDIVAYMFSYGSPIVYNNILYFIKNMEDIVAYDLATEEEITIHDFSYNDYSTSLEIDKKNAVLYYIGQSEDGPVRIIFI